MFFRMLVACDAGIAEPLARPRLRVGVGDAGHRAAGPDERPIWRNDDAARDGGIRGAVERDLRRRLLRERGGRNQDQQSEGE